MAKTIIAKSNSKIYTVEYTYDADTPKTHRMRTAQEDVPVGSNVVYVRKSEYKDAPKKVVATFVVS